MAIEACVVHQLQQKQAKRKGKPALPKVGFFPLSDICFPQLPLVMQSVMYV